MTDEEAAGVCDALERWVNVEGEVEALRRAAHALRVKAQLVEALEGADLVCHCGREDRCETTDSNGGCSYVRIAAALKAAKETPWLNMTKAEAEAERAKPYHPDPETDAEVRADCADGRAADQAAGVVEGWHRTKETP